VYTLSPNMMFLFICNLFMFYGKKYFYDLYLRCWEFSNPQKNFQISTLDIESKLCKEVFRTGVANSRAARKFLAIFLNATQTPICVGHHWFRKSLSQNWIFQDWLLHFDLQKHTSSLHFSFLFVGKDLINIECFLLQYSCENILISDLFLCDIDNNRFELDGK
jgi:hypothetical protein